jgi:hypothetical protein
MSKYKYAIIWLVLAVGIACLTGSLNLPTYHRLAEKGVSGSATIVELLPQFHNTVRYEYHVAGQTYQGRMGSRPPNPPSEQLGIGQSVVIYYDPEHPEVSVLGEPKAMFDGETFPVMLAALVLPSFAVFGLSQAHYQASSVLANPSVTTFVGLAICLAFLIVFIIRLAKGI